MNNNQTLKNEKGFASNNLYKRLETLKLKRFKIKI